MQYSSIVDSLFQPQRFNGLTASQFSPGYRNANNISTSQPPDNESQGYDFNRMLQQHLSEGTASTPYRSTLHNILETEGDEVVDEEAQHPMASSCINSAMAMSFTNVGHREGPVNVSHDRSLFHSLYGQTGAVEPSTSEITTADMCLSTLYLHELYHRQSRRRGVQLQPEQQQQWQMPHQQQQHELQLLTSQQMAASARMQSAAERTPLLHPKKT